VLDLLHPRADCTFNARLLFLVERRPSFIVGDHDNGVSAHHAAESTRPHDAHSPNHVVEAFSAIRLEAGMDWEWCGGRSRGASGCWAG
jgi:hypothetical protein